MMKKTLLALAVAALSANAFAIDLDDKTDKPDTFASEIVVKSTGTAIGQNNLTVTADAGFAVTDGFVRFDLSNGATFAGNPTLTVDGTPVTTIVSGGDGKSFVIFSSINADAAHSIELTTATGEGKGITVINKEAVGVTFGVYETASNAATQTTALNSKSGTLLNFDAALTVKAEQGDEIGKIAIGEEGKNFLAFTKEASSDTASKILKLTLAANDEYLGIRGAALNVNASDIVGSYNWTLNGNFGAADSVEIDATTAVLADDKLSATLDNKSGDVIYTVDGLTVIPESLFSATFTPEAAAGYAVSAKTFSNVASLQRDGDSDSADLVLNPNGAYSNYVRISNTSSVAGKFFLEVTNDAGESVTIALNEVEGQPESLAAGASTTQMTIQQIYAAAEAKGLSLAGQGKLRLKASGQVSQGGVSLQTYTVSKDGNSFATF